MRSNWHTKTLSEVTIINPKESLQKGKIAKKVSMDMLRPFYRDVQGYIEEAYTGGSKFQNGDTIMARITPCLENGKAAKVNFLNDSEVGFGSTEYIVFRAVEEQMDEDFLYYLITSPSVREPAIKSMVGSSGRQRVQTDVIRNLNVAIPDVDEQRVIGSYLKSIDDRIVLNDKINQNLEQQAQTVFNKFFNDNAYPIDTETTLGCVCSCELGGTPSRNKPEYWQGNIPWINSGDINRFRITSPSEYITEEGLKHSSTKLLPPKTTVLAITGATLGQVSLLEIESCANQSVVGIIPNEKVPYEFIYPFIQSNIQELISHQTGGAQQHINKQNIENLTISLPLSSVLTEYRSIIAPLYATISHNCFENECLMELRDSLLPKLMSGELDVSCLDL